MIYNIIDIYLNEYRANRVFIIYKHNLIYSRIFRKRFFFNLLYKKARDLNKN